MIKPTNDDKIRDITLRIFREMGSSFSPVELGRILDYLASDEVVTDWLSKRNGDLRGRLFQVLLDAEVFESIRTINRIASFQFSTQEALPEFVKDEIDKALPRLEAHISNSRDAKVPCPKLDEVLQTFQALAVIDGFKSEAGAPRSHEDRRKWW